MPSARTHKSVQSLDGLLRVLACEGRVTLSPVRFFSADAANLDPISLIAPAQEGGTCRATNARAAWRVGIIPAVGRASAPILVTSLGRLPEVRRCGEDNARESRRKAPGQARPDSRADPERHACDPPDDRGGAPALPAADHAAQATGKTTLMGEREGLIARIRQVRRSAAGADASARRSTVDPQDGRGARDERMDALEARIAHLEGLVEGLQDSVHRESERHAKLITELQGQIQPGAMGAALAEDARSRGL